MMKTSRKNINKILSLTQSNTGIPTCDFNTDKNVCATIKQYLLQIDQMVYKLFRLTDNKLKFLQDKERDEVCYCTAEEL